MWTANAFNSMLLYGVSLKLDDLLYRNENTKDKKYS